MHKYTHKHQWHNNTLPNIVIHTKLFETHTHTGALARVHYDTNIIIFISTYNNKGHPGVGASFSGNGWNVNLAKSVGIQNDSAWSNLSTHKVSVGTSGLEEL